MKNNDNSWSLPFRYVTGLILFVAAISLLIYAREAVKALIIAAFVAYLISPAVSILMKTIKAFADERSEHRIFFFIDRAGGSAFHLNADLF